MKEIWLVRHGETDWGAQGLLQGYAPVGLNARGREQMRRLGERLRRAGTLFDGFWCSDLKRSLESAAILQAQIPLLPTLRQDPLLREVDIGLMAGLSEEEVLQRFPEVMREMIRNPWTAKRPRGESLADVAERARTFLENLPCGRHLVVGHGGWILALLAGPLGLGPNLVGRVHLAHASITRFTWPERIVYGIGDTAHLEGVNSPVC